MGNRFKVLKSRVMWGERSKEVRNNKRGSEMLWIWGEGTQEVGMSKDKGKEEGKSSATARSMEEGERA